MHVYELKSTSEDIAPGSMYWRKLTLDGQVSAYLAAEPSAEGCIYDVVRKTALRPTGKGAETESSYCDRIVHDIANDPDRYYQRGIITRTSGEIQEYHADMVGVSAMITWARRHNVWPRQVSSCTAWNRTCEYFATCSDGRPIEDYTTVRPQMNQGRGLPVLSASARSTYAACPRKFFFAHELRRRPIADEAPALWFGKNLHTVIQSYNNPRSGDDALTRAMLRVELMPAGHERGHMRALTAGYHARYADSGLTLTSVEREFTRPLIDQKTGRESKSFVLGGFIDGIAEVTK